MFARTPRLLLRPGWPEDAKALAKALNDDGIARNLSRVPFPYGEDDAQAFLALPQDPEHPRLLVFSRTRGAPRLVGACGLAPAEDGAAELGYWIARPYWGLGFATEAARALLQAIRTIRRRPLVARHAVDNPASGRVLRKLGFRPTGDFVRVPSLGRGEDVLSLVYAEAEEDDMGDGGDVARELYDDAGANLAA